MNGHVTRVMLILLYAIAMWLSFGRSDASWAATSYIFTEIEVPGANVTTVGDINDSGQMVGAYTSGTTTPITSGFLLNGGIFTTLNVPGQARTEVLGINNAGQMVGTTSLSGPKPNGESFYLSGVGGTFTTFNPFGLPSEAVSINSNGEIVGDYTDATSINPNPPVPAVHGFSLSGIGGTFTEFQISGEGDTLTKGLNDTGQIVGLVCLSTTDCSNTPTRPQSSFLLNGNSYSLFTPPGGHKSQAMRINNNGQIIGNFLDASNIAHGYLLTGGIGGTFITIDPPGSTGTLLTGFNNLGQITGTFDDIGGQTLSFLATPAGMPILPSSHIGGVYGFSIIGTSGAPVILDPTVATGYQYQVTTGSPFGSVLIPDQIGNSHYALYVWNGSQYVFNSFLSAGTTFTFGPNGVSRFEILGIDANAGLDPNNPLAFPTTVTFLGAGAENVTMTPVTTDVSAVPEPSTWLLLGTGLAGIAAWRRMKRA